MKPSNYNIFVHYEPDKIYIGYNCVSGGLYVFNEAQFKQVDEILSGNGGTSRETEPVKEKLVKGRFLIDDNLDEIKMLKLRNYSSRFNSNGIGMVISPTLACNFSCPYCYVDREKISMNPETMTALKKFFSKRIKKTGNALVTWTGGEPLLVLESIEDMNTYFFNETLEKNLKFDCSMVTNGYLLSPVIVERLKQCGIKKLQITLDGSREYHNKSRFTPGGGKTYDIIMENLAYASNSGIKITLRSNVDKNNVEGIYKLIDDLCERGISKDNLFFAPCMVTDVEESKSNCRKNCFTNKEFASIEPQILFYSIKKGFKMYTDRLSTYHTYCGANTLPLVVIDPYANVLKCWCNLGRAENNKIGYIDQEGELCITNHGNLCNWMAWNPFEIAECLTCNVLPICMGGCMYHNLMGETDEIDAGCSHRKHNLEEMLKLVFLSMTRDCSQLNETSISDFTKINRFTNPN